MMMIRDHKRTTTNMVQVPGTGTGAKERKKEIHKDND
jgi:hypothetical protein